MLHGGGSGRRGCCGASLRPEAPIAACMPAQNRAKSLGITTISATVPVAASGTRASSRPIDAPPAHPWSFATVRPRQSPEAVRPRARLRALAPWQAPRRTTCGRRRPKEQSTPHGEIPVERDRRGLPWWIWLLVAALLGGTVALIVWNLNRPPSSGWSCERSAPRRAGRLRVPAGAAEAMRDQRAYLHVTVVRGAVR